MPEVADPCGLVHGEADVPVAVHGGLAGVHADADADGAVLGPAVRGHRPLRRRGSGDRRRRAPEDEEEGVALPVDLRPVMGAEGLAQQRVVLREQGAVALAAQLLQEPRRALDVREEKGDRPGGEVPSSRHSPFRPLPACLPFAARDGTSGRARRKGLSAASAPTLAAVAGRSSAW